MAEEQDNMTPEEKLLNVIQNGDEETATPEAKAAAQPAAEAPVAEAPAEAAAAEEKPALKLAKKEAEASPEPAPEAAEPAAAAEEAPAVASTAAPSVVSSKKKGGDGSGIKIINRMLAAGVLIMLGLSCFEVFSVIKARGSVKPPVILELPQQQDVTISEMEVKQAYAKDAFWRQKAGPDGGGNPTTTTTTTTVTTTPWAVELKRFKLMGISMKDPKADSEAILLDSRDNKMYFVRLGNSFPLLDGNVRLDDLESGRARFTDGSASVELK